VTTTPKSKKKSVKDMKIWVAKIEYTVRGTVEVEAASEAEAREAIWEEMVSPPTCEFTDMEILSLNEQP